VVHHTIFQAEARLDPMTDPMRARSDGPVKQANLYSYSDLIRTRPGIYIGGQTISLMAYHIAGYEAACRWKGVEELLDPPWSNFREYVRERTGYAESTSGWNNMLLHFCGGDEVKALGLFIKMFDAFRSGARRHDA
jgi:hypothetical protein